MVQLLKSAGSAVRALAQPLPAATDEASTNITRSIEQQKEAFSVAASDYFTRLYSIDLGLRTQIHALEEAKIITAEAAAKERSSSGVSNKFAAFTNDRPVAAAKPSTVSKDVVTGGGLGSLDVGWLNSRNDCIGKQMEAELWKEASDFLAGLESRKAQTSENMELDMAGNE